MIGSPVAPTVALVVSIVAAVPAAREAPSREAASVVIEPSSDAVRFVARTHLELLLRLPSRSVIDDFARALDQGELTRARLAQVLMRTAEFDAVTAAVTRLYFTAFHRYPDRDGFLHWGAARQRGVPVSDVARAFASSPEFTARYGDLGHQAFVERLYRNVLGREGDHDGVGYWTERLASGDLDRAGLLHAFSESPEHRVLAGEEVAISAAYDGLLGRTPDPAGFRYWVDELEGGYPPVDLVRTFLEARRTGAGQTFVVVPQEAVTGAPGTTHAFGVPLRYDRKPLEGPLDLSLYHCSFVRPTLSPGAFRHQDDDGDADGRARDDRVAR